MKWMIDADFFCERIVLQCQESECTNDPKNEKKLITLIKLFCDSVNGKSWRDAADLSRMLRRPLKQCERVWELCREEHVLRPVEDGYSALEWMKEKGYFKDEWKKRDRVEEVRDVPSRQSKYSFENYSRNMF